MSWPREVVQALLPIRIRGVEYNDPFLTIFGEEWSLNLGCPWDGTIRSVAISWEDEDVEDRAWELVGLDLVAVTDAGAGVLDLHLSAGLIRVRPDTDLDPWVLHLPGVIVVGTVS